jgi:hypothetical protein
VAGSCERDSEPSGSIKGKEFLGYQVNSQGGLCSMESVGWSVGRSVSQSVSYGDIGSEL